MEIRPYEERDRENVRQVCVNTGPGSAQTDPMMREYIIATYCDYYIDKEPGNVFVLADDNDDAQGYVFGASSFGKYLKAFGPYLKRVSKTGKTNFCEALAEIAGHALFAAKYPAHLHIDLNEGFRGKGNGSGMVNRLLDKLREQNVKGVMLITGCGNTGAIRFYNRLGFHTVMRIKGAGAEIMAREL